MNVADAAVRQQLIDEIDRADAALSLPRFGVDDSWWLGCRLRDMATERALPVAIEVRRSSAVLFACLMPGGSPDLAEWIRRKVAVVQRFERSTYSIGLRCSLEPTLFERSGMTLRDHVADGGAVPIRIHGSGMIGVVAVSGLPQEEDHALAIEALGDLKRRLEAER